MFNILFDISHVANTTTNCNCNCNCNCSICYMWNVKENIEHSQKWAATDQNFAVPYQGGQSSLHNFSLVYIKTIKHHQLTKAVRSTHFWVFVKIPLFLLIILFPQALARGQTSFSLSLFLICNALTSQYNWLWIVSNIEVTAQKIFDRLNRIHWLIQSNNYSLAIINW
jgi:hypothetical protein